MKRTGIIVLVLLFYLQMSKPSLGQADVNGAARSVPPVLVTDKSGETASEDVVATAPVPDPAAVEELKQYFELLQKNSEYYADPKFRKKMTRHEYIDLIAYKPNFGKKIWLKGWTVEDIEKMIGLFGLKIGSKEYQLTALELTERVAPFVKKHLANSDINYDYWAERFEEFGRTYVNPSKAGKEKNYFQVADYQNGNYVVVHATKPFKRKMAYFISEDHDLIIKVLLRYQVEDEREEEKSVARDPVEQTNNKDE